MRAPSILFSLCQAAVLAPYAPTDTWGASVGARDEIIRGRLNGLPGFLVAAITLTPSAVSCFQTAVTVPSRPVETIASAEPPFPVESVTGFLAGPPWGTNA